MADPDGAATNAIQASQELLRSLKEQIEHTQRQLATSRALLHRRQELLRQLDSPQSIRTRHV